jgi:hypothetical protein
MSKVVGSYASVTRGVSEQVPQDRHPGQMWEQVNMISDPVVGLARRPGSVLKDTTVASSTLTSLNTSLAADIRLYREFTFFHAGKEYTLLYRVAAAANPTSLPPFLCYNKTDGRFLAIKYADGNTSNPAAATGLAPWINGGISALASVGDYLCLAANTLGPGYSITDNYAAHIQQAVAWCRGGAYSRTYTLKITRASDSKAFTASYTTMASSYPNLLSTSDIPSGATDYQKQINDRVNAYNSAVNKWIGDAAASIQPSNIVSNLLTTLSTAGFSDQAVVGGTLILNNVSSVSCDDGGDGTLFRTVFNTVDDVSKLSSIHWGNKVVQVKANNQVDPYYMVFQADGGATWGTGKWVEGPAQTITPGQVFAVAAISTDGSTFTIGSTPAVLNTLGFSCPGFVSSVCGDKNQTAAIPYFFGKKISLMTMFQDRLVIIADGTVFMSRTGDYFNWFRQTMLSVPEDDPIQAYALGAADDTISKCVTYNKNLFLFGLRNQYTIPGSVAATPSNISISTVASQRDSMYAQPVTSGNLIFYGSQMGGTGITPFSGIINQFQLGLFQDTPETYQVSKQLSKYLKGRPIEFCAISAPDTLFTRTDGLDNGFYVYSYLDAPGSQQREFDSWGRWEVSAAMGNLGALSRFQQKLLSFWFAPNAAVGATGVNCICAEFSMDTVDRTTPFLDCQAVLGSTGPVNAQFTNWATTKMWADAYASINSTHTEFLLMEPLAGWGMFSAQYPAIPVADFVAGYDFKSYVTVTSPYVRDNNDKAIVNGRLVVTKYTASFTNSGGCDVTMTDNNGVDKHIRSFNGRLVGMSNNVVGKVPISTTNFSVPVGRANTEHKITFRSHTGLPMTISALEWTGQFFTSGRRV